MAKKYNVYWRADDGDHYMGSTWAFSEKQACNNVHYRQITSEHTIIRSNMFARLASEDVAKIVTAKTEEAEPAPEQLKLF